MLTKDEIFQDYRHFKSMTNCNVKLGESHIIIKVFY